MASLAAHLRAAKKVSNLTRLQTWTAEIILKSKETEQAKKDELKGGKKPNNEIIGKYQSLDYAIFKNAMNPAAGLGNVDLIFTGDFSNRLFPIRVSESKYTFQGADPKTPMLVRKYGDDILGLNQNTFDKLQKEIYADRLIRKIKSEYRASL